jgi:hypothetical protein
MDTSELEAAYQSVLALAAKVAGSTPASADEPRPGSPAAESPPAGDERAWRPEDVLAHLVVNDRLLARAVRSVLEGAARPYDNADAVELAELRALGAELGGPAGLVGALETSSQELLDLAGRLDEAQAATPVAIRILDGDELRLDQPLPVAALLAIQARRHLPMHEAQLGELLGRS